MSARNTEDLYGFDPAGANNFRLETIQTKQTSTGNLYLNLAHTYWPRGKLREVIDYRDVGTARSNATSYCYDALGRLTKGDRDPVSGSNSCAASLDESFAHDGLGNLTAKNDCPDDLGCGSELDNREGPTPSPGLGDLETAALLVLALCS